MGDGLLRWIARAINSPNPHPMAAVALGGRGQPSIHPSPPEREDWEGALFAAGQAQDLTQAWKPSPGLSEGHLSVAPVYGLADSGPYVATPFHCSCGGATGSLLSSGEEWREAW